MRSSNLDAIRAQLAGKTGRQYWRSLEELADSTDFREALHREFPEGACEPDNSVSRRNFLKLMGASLALAGAAGGCWRQPEEALVPYVEQPEILVPGRPLYFATTVPFNGYGMGAVVESHMGRPTKIEGNPAHPSSLGATNIYMQASVLGLYDPDRAQTLTRGVNVSTWETFLVELNRELMRLGERQGAGLRLLTGTITSPTLLSQMQQVLERYPQARWHRFDPAGRSNASQGAAIAFGQPVDAVYDFEQADVIVSLDSSFLADDPGSVRYASQFARRRRIARRTDQGSQPGQVRLSRLFVAESCPSITGAMADQRIPVRSGRIIELAKALVADFDPEGLTEEERRWVGAVAAAIGEARGNTLFIAGESQPPVVHALMHAFNVQLGNVGRTVRYIEPVAPPPAPQETLEALATDIDAGQVDVLLMMDVNPVYAAPADLDFAQRLPKVRLRVSLSAYHDETAFLSSWHVPMSHYLESWGDLRAYDGQASIIQPLIQPLYASRTPYELLAAMLGQTGLTNHSIVRGYWQTRLPQDGFERAWREALHEGVVPGDTGRDVQVNLDVNALRTATQRIASPPATQPAESMEINFRADPTIWDGSYANNGWLQELPKPITKLTWDNAALMSPATAQRLRVRNEDVVRLSYAGRELDVAAFVVPGHADDSVTLNLGYGRRRAGHVGTALGFNAYLLQTSDRPWGGGGLVVTRTGRTYPLAQTQTHFNMEGRDLVRLVGVSHVGEGPAADPMRQEHGTEEVKPRRLPLSMFPDTHPSDPPYAAGSYQWGMSIDLSSCIGCNACVVACQAENNIPIVGKEGVRNSREMHWLRIDTYFSAAAEDADPSRNPDILFQPLPCMHCEKAPCEVVCPVSATTHSHEGINEMTYNRCIGTRYCSNNCPYKVRRFNFFEYNPRTAPEVTWMQRNPDVTVRSRGVMEKCTYCIQRINQARITSQVQNRRIADGEFTTACAQACPTQAIIFGDINDQTTLVHDLKFKPPYNAIEYSMLNEELGTRPRTTYLERIVHDDKAPPREQRHHH